MGGRAGQQFFFTISIDGVFLVSLLFCLAIMLRALCYLILSGFSCESSSHFVYGCSNPPASTKIGLPDRSNILTCVDLNRFGKLGCI